MTNYPPAGRIEDLPLDEPDKPQGDSKPEDAEDDKEDEDK
jgi:hypothetical protein